MKKLIGLIIAGSLLAGILGGCAGEPAKNSEISTPESTPTVGQSDAPVASEQPEEIIQAETRIYTDTIGREVEIPVNPQRVVTINMTAETIAVGVTPIGASDNWLNPLNDEQKAGIESVGGATSLNLEKILELEPDLIITFEKVTNEETLASLSKIAPTVIGPFFGDSLGNLRTIGDMLGRSQEAEAWIDSYEAKISATKEALKDTVVEGKTALVLRLASAKDITIFPASTWPTVYDVLGLTLPDVPELAEMTGGQALSIETLTEYDPDYIFITGGDTEQILQYSQELTQSSVWKQLSAAKNNQVYIMGPRLTTGDVLALEWALDEVVQAVADVNQ